MIVIMKKMMNKQLTQQNLRELARLTFLNLMSANGVMAKTIIRNYKGKAMKKEQKIQAVRDYCEWDLRDGSQTDNLYFGFAAHHLTQPEQGFISESQLPTKLTIHAGGNFPLNKFAASAAVLDVRKASSLFNLSCSSFKISVFEIILACTAVLMSGRFWLYTPSCSS